MTVRDNIDLTPIPSQTVGPYFHLGLTDARSISCIAGPKIPGERVWLTFRVLDGDGVPVPDAMIEVWQADSEGRYVDSGPKEGTAPGAAFRGFGRMPTGEDGSCDFVTIKPGRVPGPGDTLQAPHFNIWILARGLLKALCSRVYFAGEPANADDPVLALVAKDRRATLLAQPVPGRSNAWSLEIRLSGEDETVFFDV